MSKEEAIAETRDEIEDPYEYRTTGVFKAGQSYRLPEEDWGMIFPSEHNIRKTDIKGTIEWDDLRASIKEGGIDDSLDVTPDGGVTDGQRRLLAIQEIVEEEDAECQEMGTVREGRVIPISVEDLTSDQVLKKSINKNVHRKDIDAHDLADGISDLVESRGSQHAAALFLGMSDAWVSDRLAVLSTPERSFDKKEQKVIEKKVEPISIENVPKSKVSDVGELLRSGGQSKRLKKTIVEKAGDLPRTELRKLKKQVKKEKDITPEKIIEKIEETQEKIKRTTNRTFRLDNEINDALNVAKGRGLIEDHHAFGNDVLRKALEDLGVLT